MRIRTRIPHNSDRVIAVTRCARNRRLLAVDAQAVTPNTFNPVVTFYLYTLVILGGAGTVLGPVLGSVVFSALGLALANRLVGNDDGAAIADVLDDVVVARGEEPDRPALAVKLRGHRPGMRFLDADKAPLPTYLDIGDTAREMTWSRTSVTLPEPATTDTEAALLRSEAAVSAARRLETAAAEAEAPATKTVETSTNQSVSTTARLNSEGEAYGVSLSVREGRRETSVMLTRGEARHVAQDLLAATQQHL